MVSSTFDPLCTRCGHLHSLHKHVERPDIWWCAGNGMGAGRCTCPVFTDEIPEPPEPDPNVYDGLDEADTDDEPVHTPFEMSFVFVNRGESIVWQRSGPHTISIPARAVELAPSQKANGCISLEQLAEVREFRLDCVIDDGALSGRQAAWLAILAGLRIGPAPRVTFAEREVCNLCKQRLELQIGSLDEDGYRMFHAYDTLYKGDYGLFVDAGNLFHLEMMFDPNALKPDEQIPIGFLRVVMSGMLITDDDE